MDSDFQDLDTLMHGFGTDKGTNPTPSLIAKNYSYHYAKLLAPIRYRKLKLLEIGVARGASLRTWHAFLPNSEIYGIDVKESAALQAADRTRVFIGDQSDPKFLAHVLQEMGGYADIVIDDGSHKSSDQLLSLNTLFRYVTGIGFYAIEDLHVQGLFEYGTGTCDSARALAQLLLTGRDTGNAGDVIGVVPWLLGMSVFRNIWFLFRNTCSVS